MTTEKDDCLVCHGAQGGNEIRLENGAVICHHCCAKLLAVMNMGVGIVNAAAARFARRLAYDMECGLCKQYLVPVSEGSEMWRFNCECLAPELRPLFRAYELRHPLQTLRFGVITEADAQDIWKSGLKIQKAAALQTRLIRLSDGADITPKEGSIQ